MSRFQPLQEPWCHSLLFIPEAEVLLLVLPGQEVYAQPWFIMQCIFSKIDQPCTGVAQIIIQIPLPHPTTEAPAPVLLHLLLLLPPLLQLFLHWPQLLPAHPHLLARWLLDFPGNGCSTASGSTGWYSAGTFWFLHLAFGIQHLAFSHGEPFLTLVGLGCQNYVKALGGADLPYH